jgi:DNA-binding transcriptional LysR family regulator
LADLRPGLGLRRAGFPPASGPSRDSAVAVNLPTDLLRSFVAIAEAGSMIRAAERICVTQSALSLQMKRLAEVAQAPIFERHSRGLLLTAAGEDLLVYARGMLDLNDRALASIGRDTIAGPARVGIVQDFAEPLLSGMFVQFLKQYPEVRLQVRVASTAALNAEFMAGLLDIMLGLGAPDDPHAIGVAQMAWCGHPDLARSAELQLAIMEPPCLFREAALAALEQADRAYRIVLETPSVAVLKAAMEAGLAITCRTGALVGERTATLEIDNAPLPQVGFLMRQSPAANPIILRLSAKLREALTGRDAVAA